MEFVKELLLSDNYWVLNKSVVSEFGVETAFILGVLAEAEKTLADEEGWFYQTSETLEKITGLSNHKQTMCFKILKEKGILEQKNKGVPMKRYFKINFENIQKLLFKNFKNCNSKNLKSSIQNFSNNKESSYKENKNKENKNKEKYIYVFNNPSTDFEKAFTDFENFRIEMGKPMTEKAKNLILDKLDKLAKTDAEKIEILNQSIMLNWIGVFEIKGKSKTAVIPKDDDKYSVPYASKDIAKYLTY